MSDSQGLLQQIAADEASASGEKDPHRNQVADLAQKLLIMVISASSMVAVSPG